MLCGDNDINQLHTKLQVVERKGQGAVRMTSLTYISLFWHLSESETYLHIYSLYLPLKLDSKFFKNKIKPLTDCFISRSVWYIVGAQEIRNACGDLMLIEESDLGGVAEV